MYGQQVDRKVDASAYHHAMLEDEFHHILFELGQEALARVLHEGHRQLQYPRHAVKDLDVARRLKG